ncbi:phenylacetic acid degradation protein [Desulfosarcina ovata subsp. sediminis]|uniref:Phenylacetic acid degradation protein n=1 Tax=Desulfosarcina ovata subsp. sediminis TaxID=885957 RepID=A0A5K7ZLB5_9BACT|nr:PaaI family thioesterase [Desulfosarcina ovata]BBO80797.1 phenylacetic acid degradation protein [Desulfosarcina ovata subsp. sediminis]
MKKRGIFWDIIEGRTPQPPSHKLLGWKLINVNPDDGTIEIEFEGKKEFLNPVGNINGGIISAMLDLTLGPALGAKLGPDEFGPTIELKTSFVKPAKPGKLIGKGRVLKMGETICFLEAELFDMDKSLIAKASATACIVKNHR